MKTRKRHDTEVFSIVRALLVDPDVLCAFRPLSLVPLDIKPRMGQLLRLWQAGHGAAVRRGGGIRHFHAFSAVLDIYIHIIYIYIYIYILYIYIHIIYIYIIANMPFKIVGETLFPCLATLSAVPFFWL